MLSEARRFRSCVMVGLGYIGLPTATVIARTGLQVTGFDINSALVQSVNDGACPITEPGLPEAMRAVVESGHLRADTTPPPADVYLIAVPTPFEGGYTPDVSYVESAVRAIAPVIERGSLVIVESTIPVGTTEQVGSWLEDLRPDLTFSQRGASTKTTPDVLIAHCPERIMPGQMLIELIENDRVIGGLCPHAGFAAHQFYKMFVDGKCHVTDVRTAEMAKLTENAFRDVNIAFANEIAAISSHLDIDAWKLIELANHHPRVNILQPGPGVGGHCIAVDPWFLVSAMSDEARLIREARWINSGRPLRVVREILAELETRPASKVCCFGLAYKANIDDLRESPAVEITEHLARELRLRFPGTDLQVVEPNIDRLPASMTDKSIELVSLDEGLEADFLVMLVDHREFLDVPPARLAGRSVVDTRGAWRQHQTPSTESEIQLRHPA